jgi:uncharacterized protein (DUF433 family)
VFILAGVRRTHGVSLQRIRTSLTYVKKHMGMKRPLIQAKFRTDGLDLFIREMGNLVIVSRDGQLAMREAFESRLKRIDWDKAGTPVRLFPLVRLGDADPPRTVVIDPSFGFGHPVIVGTGIRTSVVVDRYRAGESFSELAADYNVDEEHVEDAVRCAIPAAC